MIAATLSARRFRRPGFPQAAGGAVLIAAIVAIAVLAPWIVPFDPLAQDLGQRLLPPSAQHWLGTDGLGRDILSRLIQGTRPTLEFVALVVVLAVPFGVAVGMIAGYVGGRVERCLNGLTDIVMAFPQLVLAMAFTGLLGPGLINGALSLALTGWPAYARLMRAQARLVARSDYIAAARLQGIHGLRLLWGHVLPCCLPSVQVRLALDLAGVILAAAGLGFLGLGVRPPMPEWGAMVADGSKVIFDQWWVAASPGAAILLLSLAFNLLAEGLRDVEDPFHA